MKSNTDTGNEVRIKFKSPKTIIFSVIDQVPQSVGDFVRRLSFLVELKRGGFSLSGENAGDKVSSSSSSSSRRRLQVPLDARDGRVDPELRFGDGHFFAQLILEKISFFAEFLGVIIQFFPFSFQFLDFLFVLHNLSFVGGFGFRSPGNPLLHFPLLFRDFLEEDLRLALVLLDEEEVVLEGSVDGGGSGGEAVGDLGLALDDQLVIFVVDGQHFRRFVAETDDIVEIPHIVWISGMVSLW